MGDGSNFGRSAGKAAARGKRSGPGVVSSGRKALPPSAGFLGGEPRHVAGAQPWSIEQPGLVPPGDVPTMEEATPRQGWREAIVRTAAQLHYELVDIERAPRGLLRVFIDRMPGHDYANPLRGDTAPDTGQYITVDDCEKVTRQLQYVLEVEGLDYARLEVSSPGLDRPLRSESDLERFSGQVVNLTLKLPFQGRKNWRGLVSRAEGGEGWNLRLTDGAADTALGFTWNEVREARLVPVLDFKGRKPRDGGGAEVAAAPSALTTDGG